MAIVPYKGKFNYVEHGMTGSVAAVKGSVCRFDSGVGYLENGAVASAGIFGVWAQTVTASATNGATTNIAIPFDEGQEWEADCAGTPAITQVGSIVSLEDVSTMDEDDTGNTPLFRVVKLKSAADKKIIVTPMIKNFTAILA